MKSRRFVRYCVVGAGGTLAHYLVLMVLMSSGLAAPAAASSAGAVVGSIVNYQLNYHFTFDSKESHAKAGPRFFLVAIAGLFLNWLAMVFFAERLKVHYLLAQFGATALVLFVTFVVNSAWSFKPRN